MSYRLRVFKNTYFSSLGLYVEYGIGLITSIVMARTLGPSDYGTYALAVWIVSLALTVAQGAINQGIIKFVAEARGNDDMGQVGAVMNYFSRVLRFNIFIVMMAVGAGLWHFGPQLIPLADPLWLLVPWAAIAVRTTYMYLIGVGKGFEDFRAIARVALIVSPLYLIVTLVAGWLDFSVEQFLIIFLAFGILFCTVTWIQMRRHLQVDADEKLDGDTQRRMRRHLFIVTARVVFAFLASSQVEILLLGMLESQSDVGLFRVAKRMAGGLALLIPGMFMAVMLPVMSRTIGEGGEAMVRRYRAFLRYVFIAAAPLACFGALFATPIIVFLYGNEYAAAGTLFAVILAVDSLGFLAGSSNSFLVSVDRQLTILCLVFTATVLKLALGYTLIKHFGLLGAVSGYAGLGITMNFTMMTIAQRHLGVSFEWRRFALIAASAALSLIPVFPLYELDAGLVGIVAAAPIYGVTYALAVLFSGCLSASDVGLLQEVREKWLPKKLPGIDALLKRARHTA